MRGKLAALAASWEGSGSVSALGCGRESLDGLDPDDGGDHGQLKPVIGFAEVLLDGGAIQSAGNLLRRGDRKLVAGDLDQTAALELVLEQLALGFGALQDSVGLAEQVGKGFVREVVEA